MASYLTTSQLCCYAAATGLFSHLSYFIHGEHHLKAPILFRIAILGPFLLSLGLLKFASLEAVQAGTVTAYLTVSYHAGLWISIILYRVLFHRLGRFPGPFMAKVTKLWNVSKIASRSDNFKFLDDLHREYGEFVRTGPNEISISHPDAVQLLLGPGSKCTKAPWYDANHPVISLHTLRDKGAHDARRRIWDRGFNTKALRSYEDRVMRYAILLEQQMTRYSDQIINASQWFHFYGFDVMGDIAFGKSFDMTQSGRPHRAFQLLREGMKPLGALGPIPWAFCILTSIPGLGSGFKEFVSWCTEQVEKRKAIEMEVPDVMSWLIDSSMQSKTAGKKLYKAEEALLHSDSRLIIVAGSDTTSSTLAYLFYELAKNESHQQKLRQELNPLKTADGDFSFKDLQMADHLNAVINETLRLHPPVPSGVLRLTPPEGIQVGERFIPGNTTVVAPSYTIGRLESCFTDALAFVPERWYSKPEMVKHKMAFAPFSLGSQSCVGKQLALMELRIAVARLVTKFNIQFAPGENGEKLMNDSKDYFTISIADLKLCFSQIAPNQ